MFGEILLLRKAKILFVGAKHDLLFALAYIQKQRFNPLTDLNRCFYFIYFPVSIFRISLNLFSASSGVRLFTLRFLISSVTRVSIGSSN